jgi:hypothetical protein
MENSATARPSRVGGKPDVKQRTGCANIALHVVADVDAEGTSAW